MFKIVFSDSLLYAKQLSLFCLLWLISACADRIGYFTKFPKWWNNCTNSKNSSC